VSFLDEYDALEQDNLTEIDPSDVVRFLEAYKNEIDSPELQLLYAVMVSAIDELKEYSAPRRRRGAADWFMREDDEGVHSFVSVCDYLGLSSSAMRKSLAPIIAPALECPSPQDEAHPAAVNMPHDPDAEHQYVSAHHCYHCQKTYRKWYRANGSKATVGPARKRRAA